MVGTELAPMIADIKRVSQVFQGFKSTDMLEKSQVLCQTPPPQYIVEAANNRSVDFQRQSPISDL